MGILLAILTFFMVLLSLALIGLILLQKSSGQQGMGAAMGGGVADQTFGAETNSILSKNTQRLTIVYFVFAFILYLGFFAIYNNGDSADEGTLLDIVAEDAEAAAAEAEAASLVDEAAADVEPEAVDVVNPLDDVEAAAQDVVPTETGDVEAPTQQ